MNLGIGRYYLDQLEKEQLRLFGATSLAEEDATLAQITVYCERLAEIGVVYDEGSRRWMNVKPPQQAYAHDRIHQPYKAVSSGHSEFHEWEVRFEVRGGLASQAVRLNSNDPCAVIQTVEKRKQDAEIWRDGRFVCKMFSAPFPGFRAAHEESCREQ